MAYENKPELEWIRSLENKPDSVPIYEKKPDLEWIGPLKKNPVPNPTFEKNPGFGSNL